MVCASAYRADKSNLLRQWTAGIIGLAHIWVQGMMKIIAMLNVVTATE